ncbi:gliding motility-associated ABC transporter permease subunit GldF [Bacteroidota bacterium]
MIALLKKEIAGFFTSITAYLVIIVFLMINSLFIWIFPNQLNIIDSGYASLDPLFSISPWVFLFLVPAITMKFIAEEKRIGTLEFLLTKPISEYQIILAKYFSAVLLVLLSILPTLIYFYSIFVLGSPKGNIDIGGTIGSYIGLFFLASVYVSIGIFASSLTDNQIVAFIFGILMCLLSYIAFEYLSQMFGTGEFAIFIAHLGIREHYESIGRGVIDSRDILFFLSEITVFLILTKISVQNRKM